MLLTTPLTVIKCNDRYNQKKKHIHYNKTLKLTTTLIVVSPKSKCESSPTEEAIPLPTHTHTIFKFEETISKHTYYEGVVTI